MNQQREETGKMIIQRVRVDERQQATITCPSCTDSRTVDAGNYRKHNHRVVAKCGCGFMFFIVFSRKGSVEIARR